MKYKIGDIIIFNKSKKSKSIIIEIIHQHLFHYYRFRFIDENNTHIMSCENVDNSSEFYINYIRKEKLKNINEI